MERNRKGRKGGKSKIRDKKKEKKGQLKRANEKEVIKTNV